MAGLSLKGKKEVKKTDQEDLKLGLGALASLAGGLLMLFLVSYVGLGCIGGLLIVVGSFAAAVGLVVAMDVFL